MSTPAVWLAAGMLALAAGCGQESSSAGPEPVEKGRAIFEGKGNCTACHTIGADKDGRGPDLAEIGARSKQRAATFGLKGARAATTYLTRSVVRARADVVKGFNPMPESWLASGLADDEIVDVVVYLQSLGGKPKAADVVLPQERLKTLRKEYEVERKLFALGDPKRGKQLFFDLKGNTGCVRCHTMDGVGKDICPNLTRVGRVQRPRYVFESILDSSAFIVGGYRQLMIWDDVGLIHVGLPVKEDEQTLTLVIDDDAHTEVIQKSKIDEQRLSDVSRMPGNFAELLTAQQVLDLVAYVLDHDKLPKAGKGDNAPPPKVLPAPSLTVFPKLTADQDRYRMAMERGDPVIGSRIYAYYCIMCHGQDGTGTGFNAVNLETKPANHTDNRRMAKTEDRLLHGVVTRGGMKTGRSFLMPPWGGTLSDADIWDLVAHLRTLHAHVK